MSELKEIAAKAAEQLTHAFVWAGTPQGHNYWAKVYQDLCKLGEIRDIGHSTNDETDAYPRGTAPLSNVYDRNNALELADLIDDLLLYFMTPVLADNDPFLRWAGVQDDLFELGGEYPAEGQIPTQAEWEQSP